MSTPHHRSSTDWRLLLLRRALCGILVAVFGCSTPLSAQDADEPPAEIVTALRAYGMDEAKARKLALAAQKAEEEEAVAPLIPFLADSDLASALGAAFMVIEVGAEEGVRAVQEQIGKQEGNKPALFLSLCWGYEQENVDFLIARLTAEPTKEERDAIEFSLRVVTAQKLSGAEAWAAWWKDERETFGFSEPETMEEQVTRMRTAATALKAGALRDVIAGSIKAGGNDKVTKALSNVAGMMESLAEATQRGQELILSEQASAGDVLFSEGKLEAAEQKYSQALEADPKDERSRFLRACLFFEAGRYLEAAEQFAHIEKHNEDAAASKFLRVLSERRQLMPDEPLLNATLEEFHKIEPPIEVGALGWSDELITDLLMAQRLAGNGVTAIDPARLDELLAANEEDAEIAAGVALLRHRDMRAVHLHVAWERHPQSILLTAALLQEKLKAQPKQPPETVDALIDDFVKLDEQNSLPRYLRVAHRLTTQPKNPGGKDKVKTLLSPTMMAELAEANALERFDSGQSAAIAAQYRVLKELGQPFRGNVQQGVMSFNGTLAGLAGSLKDTADAALEEGRTDAAKNAGEMIGLLAARMKNAKGSLIDQVYAEAVTSFFSVSVLERQPALPGQAKPDAARPVTETRKALDQIDILALLSLPIPSLENAIVERMLADETGFLLEQAARKRTPEAAETP